MIKSTRKRPASLIALENPVALSIVENPANRVGFKVKRDDQGAAKVIRKRSDGEDSSLLLLILPDGTTEDHAIGIMATYGMGDDYEFCTTSDSKPALKRKKCSDDVTGVSIPLPDGCTAVLSNTAFAKRSDPDQSAIGVTLVRMEFDQMHDEAFINTWLAARSMATDTGLVKEPETAVTVLHRCDPKDSPTKSIELEAGVVAVVMRSATTDVPVRIFRSVVEQSYGNWGWGHMDFASCMADPAFTEQSWSAIDVLEDVLGNIVIYSGLTLDERKKLLHNALVSYESFMVALMDSLPMGATVATTSDKLAKPAPAAATTAEVAGTETTAERSDDGAAPATTDGGSGFVTRAELEEVVANAIRSAMQPAQTPAPAEVSEQKRSDGVGSADLRNMLSSIVADAVKPLSEKVESVVRSVTKLEEESVTIVHSGGDGTDVTQKRSDEGNGRTSVFSGLFHVNNNA